MLISFQVSKNLSIAFAFFAIFFIPIFIASSQDDKIEVFAHLPDSVEEVDHENGKEHDMCVICFEDLKILPGSYLTRCGHFFHATCIANWVEIRPTCPWCKNGIRLWETVDFPSYFERIKTEPTPKLLIDFLKYSIIELLHPEHYETIMNEIKNRNPEWTVNDKPEDDLSLLEWAFYQVNTKAITVLLKFGADLNQLNSEQLILLASLAIERRELDLATFLINRFNFINSSILFLAVCSDATDIVKLLVEKGVDLNQKEESTNLYAVQIAIIKLNSEILKYLLETGVVNLQVKTQWNENLLHLAVKLSNREIIKMLIEHESPDYNIIEYITQFNNENESPLGLAIMDTNIRTYSNRSINEQKLYEFIIDNIKKKHPNWARYESIYGGKSILEIAVDKKNIAAVLYIVNSGANINQLNCEDFDRLIAHLLKANNFESMNFFINNWDFEEKKCDFIESLQYSVDHKMEEVVNMLIHKGADVRKNSEAVRIVINDHNFELFKIIFETGKIDPSARFSAGNNLLHYAVLPRNTNILKLLLENEPEGWNLHEMASEKSILGTSPLEAALMNENSVNFQLLVDYIRQKIPSWNVDDSDEYQHNLLMLAAKHKNFEAIKYLLDIGADIKLQNDPYVKFLIYQILLNSGSSRSAELIESITGIEGNCAEELCVAIAEDARNVVKFLIDKGADINKRVFVGSLRQRNAIETAISSNNMEIFKMLLESGRAEYNVNGNSDECIFQMRQSRYH